MVVMDDPSVVFAEVQGFDLLRVPSKWTQDCFSIKEKYPVRSTDIDGALPQEQLLMGPCSVTRLTVANKITFRQIISAILDVAISSIDREEQVANRLKKPEHLLSLPQKELLIARAEWVPGQSHYAFVIDREEHVRLLRIYGRRQPGTFGVTLVHSHFAEKGDLVYVRNFDETKLRIF